MFKPKKHLPFGLDTTVYLGNPNYRTFAPMTDELLEQTAALVCEPLELENTPPPADEAELLALVAERVADLLDKQPEYLMSLLYRLDVLEKKIRPVMHPGAPEPANIGLARLILERQKQRAETKRTIKPKPLEDMEDLAW